MADVLKLGINSKKEVKKPTNMWRSNNIQLENDWFKEEMRASAYIKNRERQVRLII